MMKNNFKRVIVNPILIIIILVLISFSLLGLPLGIFAEDNKSPKDKDVKLKDNITITTTSDTDTNTTTSDTDTNTTTSDTDTNTTTSDTGQNITDKDVELIIIPNIVPIAKPSGKFSSEDKRTVNFDGSGSKDDDGTIASYSWNFGDGSTGSGVSTSHTYGAPGKYKAILTVTDNEGAKAEALIEIIINSSESNIENTISIPSNQNTDNMENIIEDNNKMITGETKDNSINDSNEYVPEIRKIEDKINKNTEKINESLQNILGLQKDTLLEEFNININSISDIVNLNEMIKNNKIVSVIDLDDIIDLNYKEDVNQINENTVKYPQLLTNFWGKIKMLTNLY